VDVVGEDPKGLPRAIAVLQRFVPAQSFVTGKGTASLGTSQESRGRAYSANVSDQ
jgi:hypothetical protein